MIKEKIELIVLLICLILIGCAIYFVRYRKKGRPKVGVKRESLSEYFTDYWDLKLYWTSICFIGIGVTILLVIGIIELAF